MFWNLSVIIGLFLFCFFCLTDYYYYYSQCLGFGLHVSALERVRVSSNISLIAEKSAWNVLSPKSQRTREKVSRFVACFE